MDKSSESSIARKALRQQLLTLRSDMAQAGRVHLDTLLCQQLLEADLLQSADNIGVYLPIRSEPDLSACYAQWRAQGRRLALTGRNEPLTFRVWEAEAPLRTAAFGVQVPETDETVVPDVLVIPCVGFRVLDGRPYRLGYGGGFYDRTLALPAFRTTGSVGVAYDQAETSSWAPDVWDMPLSMLLTPSRCIVAMASP